ncbi:MAG: DUF4920 domain-containing protein [Chryseolinea sp.]
MNSFSFFSVCMCLLIITSMSLNAQPPKAPVIPGTTFGAAISADGSAPVADLSRLKAGEESVGVKVSGEVTDVCPKMGCWLSLKMPDNSKVFVKMKDYGFFVPVELVGKTVVIDGQAKLLKTSVEELKHYAKDAQKSDEEIKAITDPKEEIQLMANGILIVK